MIELGNIGPYIASAVPSIDALDKIRWQAFIGPDQPYLDPRHLGILEKTGLIGEAVGIIPYYVTLTDQAGVLKGAAPAFLKDNSNGELGIDWGLPLAHERAVGPYYPKLVVEVPLTPWPGQRLLVDHAEDCIAIRESLLIALNQLAQKTGVRSVQIAYGTREDQVAAQAQGYVPADTLTFTWRSRAETDFDAFRSSLTKGGRWRLKTEYEKRVAEGVVIRRVQGSEITPDLMSKIHELYCDVFEQHAHAEWLNRAYFDALLQTMPDAIEFLAAWEDDVPIAGLLCFCGEKTISAQHWVTKSARIGLLFSLMYHSYKEAIERGYSAVDYGTIGAHKALRAAAPEPLFHAFKFVDDAFQNLATTVLAKRQKVHEAAYLDFARQVPYKDKRLPE
ncbi:GNAT family N-acetyltransferase [Roseovarius rhodophyticola]|uniref:GNAT family N-acetyltransferase n=1 Tax=Roseovarius rhodophyticola TaxID=3080827 RepID=A0ABZ2TG94_9RHOB|nr:GNAT family N-acetyltransferase [Roseovarius sp. W115]MDV2928990.1 GNAT family N-acetyltransferase [Roseovarius sp. W115]